MAVIYKNGVAYDSVTGKPLGRLNPRSGNATAPLRGNEPNIPGSNVASPVKYTLEDIASNLFQETDPLREGLIDRSKDFLTNGMNPMATPEYSAIRSYANQQAKQAKSSILETLPSGGTLLDKLADVDIGKARTLTDAASGIYSDNLNRALQLATGGTQSAISAQSGADQLRAAREQANAARDAGEKNALGSAIGTGVGFYFGGPQGAAAGANAGGK